MKCINCSNDCKYSDRKDGKCPTCKHAFAFEPRTGDPCTDGLFQSALDTVSGNKTIHFGVEHVYYEVCRRLGRKNTPAIVFMVVFSLLTGLLLCALPSPLRWFVPLIVAAVGLIVVWTLRQRSAVTMHRAEFDRLWKKWCAVHGVPKGVIVRKEAQAKPKAMEPDLGDYSFDRAVICDRPETVDLLLANQFHFENNCAVLSIDGYPPGPFAMIREMLQRNPHLQVFVLHDATPEGCRLAHRLMTDKKWFAGGAQVIDVGLRPVHAEAFKGLWREAGVGVEPRNGISVIEAKWLSSYNLELAAVRPEQVLKRLFRAINRRFDPKAETTTATSGDGGGVIIFGSSDDTSFREDARDMDGGADAFG